MKEKSLKVLKEQSFVSWFSKSVVLRGCSGRAVKAQRRKLQTERRLKPPHARTYQAPCGGQTRKVIRDIVGKHEK